MNYDFSLIHKFKMGDSNIVFDINSGIVHSLSDEAWAFLIEWENANGDGEKAITELKEKYDIDMLRDIWNQMEEMKKSGILFSYDEAIENFKMPENSIVKALCLHVAHDCNLRCKYCFGETGGYGGERKLMDVTTGKQALDYLMKVSGPRKHVEIDYFGGEPLLNFDVVKELVYYGKKRAKEEGKILKQTLTTNSVLLNQEIIDFLNKEDIFMILSLDGRPEIQNNMRPFAKDKPSYDKVYAGISRYLQSNHPDTYFIRGTYTHFNTDFCQDIKHMVDCGYRRISFEPVVAPYEKDYALKNEDIQELGRQYEELADLMLEHYKKKDPISFFHFNVSLDGGPCLPKRLSGCGAGHEYLAVSPEGDLYPCHQFVGQEEFKVGNVVEGVKNHKWGREFKEAHVLNKEDCMKCWARFLCSGGCHANAYAFNGDVLKPYKYGCELQQKRLECAIYLQVKYREAEEKQA